MLQKESESRIDIGSGGFNIQASKRKEKVLLFFEFIHGREANPRRWCMPAAAQSSPTEADVLARHTHTDTSNTVVRKLITDTQIEPEET